MQHCTNLITRLCLLHRGLFPISILVDLAFRVCGRRFLFNSVVASAVCLLGHWAGWTQLRKQETAPTYPPCEISKCDDIIFLQLFSGGLRKPPIIPLVPPRIDTTGRVHRVQEGIALFLECWIAYTEGPLVYYVRTMFECLLPALVSFSIL